MDQQDIDGQDDMTEKKTGAWFLFSFRGRISRKQYWVFNGFILLAGILFGIMTEAPEDFSKITKPQLLFMIWMMWPSMAVQGKRWHDRDKSALWVLINFIPIAGPIFALIDNGFIAGTLGPNRFGPDPLEEQH